MWALHDIDFPPRLRYIESIRQRSQLSEEQAAELAAEIDRSVWSGIKSTFVEA